MFSSARLRLTLLYCAIFFSTFWLFSGGLYLWMSQSFGEGYIAKVTQKENEQTGNHENGPDITAAETATIAGTITLSQLKVVLLTLNGGLLIFIPVLAWTFTGRSLRPVKHMYDQQKQFVSDASHELRTPLTIIRGELDLALKRKRSLSEYKSALVTTNLEVARLQQLVENLLIIARVEQKTTSDQMEFVDIREVIQTVVQRLLPLARAKHVTIVPTYPRDQLLTRGVKTMLEQLFENIITNAIKYSHAKGKISIGCKLRDGYAVIAITDSGVGMSQEAVKHAFDRFYRESYARDSEGYGLGLAISRMIAQQHRGIIKITSKQGKGTTVVVKLPIASS
jgi:signal transduction histidine kinase